MLCDNLGGVEWGWVREKSKRGENICTHTTDSLCCIAETSTTLESKHTPIKKKKKICELSSVSCLSMRCGV